MTQLPPADSQPDPAVLRPRYVDYGLEEPAAGVPRGSLLEYWRILRQRKGAVAIFGCLGILAGVLYTLPQTPVYQARTTIEIQGLNEDFLHMRDLSPTSGNAPGDPGTDLQTQVRILQTRALLNRVIQKLSLEKKPLVANPNRLEAWCNALGITSARAGDGRESALRAIAASLHVRAQVNTRLIEILCDSTNPQVAAEFANALAAEFIEQNLEARWQATQHTGTWLTRQMEDVKIKLEKSEDALQAYARETGLVFTQEKDNVADQKLKRLQDELSKAEAERITRQSRYELATRAAADSLGEVLDDGSLKDLQGKLTDLRRQLAELSSSFTSEHYRVKRVEAQIATLEASLETARANILSRIRNDFESAQRREKLLAADYSASVQVVTAQADKVTHYNILKREVDTSRQLYESLLQRVKEAGIASALRASNVRVVDPAVPPVEPYPTSRAIPTTACWAWSAAWLPAWPS